MVSPMKRLIQTLLTASIFALHAAGPCAAADGSAAAPPQEGGNSILLLLNGELIQGQVTRLEQQYRVILPTGRIFVPIASVEAVCDTPQDAYELRRSRIVQGQAQDHAELAQWCQRHGLESMAEQELRIARQLEPNNPMVGLIQRRLEAARMPLESADEASADEAGAGPTPQQLEDFAAGLPAGTVEVFTRVVQPLLLNRCATAGCHTERSDNEYRLERSRPGVPLGRTSTYRNLLATLKLVDVTNPDQSELLRPKQCPNRLQSATNASLSQSGQYRFLVAWVTLLAHCSTGPAPSPVATSPAAVPQTIRTSPPPVSEASTPATPPAATPVAPDSPFNIAPAKNASFAPAAAADPFDPEIFNRRYGTSPAPQSQPGDAPKTRLPMPNAFLTQ